MGRREKQGFCGWERLGLCAQSARCGFVWKHEVHEVLSCSALLAACN